jgi:ATP-dependent Zn protease
MQEPDKARIDDQGPKTPEFRVSARTCVIWIVIIGLIPLLMVLRQNRANPGQHLRQYEFVEKVEGDLIARATITLDPQSPNVREIRGRYFKTDADGQKTIENGKLVEVPFYTEAFITDQNLQTLLNRPEYYLKRSNTLLINLIWSLGPILLVALLIWFVFIRQIKLDQKRQTPPQERPKTEIL